MTHPTFQKLKFASFRVEAAGIQALDAKNLLLKEPQTTERDELIVNCDNIIAYCDHAYKTIEKMIEKLNR